MRILVFGAGVLGSCLARDLHRGGKDVTLLARGEWAKQIKEHGLRIKGLVFQSKDKLKVVESLEKEDRYDAIIVVMQFTQLENIIPTLQENVSENIILVGNNMLANQYEHQLSGKHVWFAFASAAGRREANRVCGISLHKITLGSARGNCENEGFVRSIFDGTCIRIVISGNMDEWLKTHAAFILPMAEACYQCDGDLRKIKNDVNAINHIIDEMTSYYEVIMRCGYNVVPQSEYEYVTVTREKCFKFIRLMCGTILGKIAISDHAMSAKEEMKALQEEMNQMIKMSN